MSSVIEKFDQVCAIRAGLRLQMAKQWQCFVCHVCISGLIIHLPTAKCDCGIGAGIWEVTEKPDGPSAVGDIYEKRAHTKTAVNAPRIKVAGRSNDGKSVEVYPHNFSGAYGWKQRELRKMTTARLNKEWRKV